MNPFLNKFFYFAALLVLAGVLLQVTQNELAFPVFLTGAISFAIVRISLALKTKDRRHSRIPLIQLMSATALLVAAYFMHRESNSWAVFVFITAMLEGYTTFRIGSDR